MDRAFSLRKIIIDILILFMTWLSLVFYYLFECQGKNEITTSQGAYHYSFVGILLGMIFVCLMRVYTKLFKASFADSERFAKVEFLLKGISRATTINVTGFLILLILIFVDMWTTNLFAGMPVRLYMTISFISYFCMMLGGIAAFVNSIFLLVQVDVHPFLIFMNSLTIFIYPFTFIVPPAVIANIVARLYLKRKSKYAANQ